MFQIVFSKVTLSFLAVSPVTLALCMEPRLLICSSTTVLRSRLSKSQHVSDEDPLWDVVGSERWGWGGGEPGEWCSGGWR